MAFLGKAKKQDLILLAEELGQRVSDKMTNIDLRNIIIGSKDYEEEFVGAQLSVILEERFERESEEKIARQLAIEQQQREFEDGDIVLFLTLFDRQAKRIGVEKTNWVSALLARMPPDITQLIAREPEDKFDNYDYIKGVLLKRFKMSPDTFRQKFMKHQRIPARSWRDFLFEITSYFEEWLDGMEHFVDEWAKFYEPSVLADKLDGYENVRSSVKKTSQPEMSLSNTSDSRCNIKKEHAIIKNDFQSKRYKLPFKQEPKQPTFKPTCYSCGRVGHTSRVCHAKNHKKTSPNRQINAVETNERFQEQSSAILTAKVAIPVYSPTKEDEKIDELQFVHIKCGNEILKAVIDTGAQISVVRADVVEGQSVDSGGTIQIMSAFGEREVTELKIFNLKIDDSRHGVVPIMCAVSKRLVNDMLVCSSAYEALLENVQFIHNPANSYVSSRAVEGITADDPKAISSQEMTRETYPSEIYIQSLSKANEEVKAVEEGRKMEEERRVNEIIALEEEMRLKNERWLVEEQMRHVQEEHETSMKKQKCLPEERCKRMNEQNQLLNEEEEKFSDEDMEVTQAIEKVLVSKGEQIQTRSTDQYAVAQSVVVEKEQEEISVDVIKDKDESNPGKLAWKLSDFIKRDGTVKIRRSSRENRSTRKRVRLKLRPQDNIYRDGKVARPSRRERVGAERRYSGEKGERGDQHGGAIGHETMSGIVGDDLNKKWS
ncbi:retrovirus-related Pol polyprotein from transposon 297 [Trichonephila clavipes]|nr:retrovirus-related Pol polyprotein from transposon 297 [Trichonephila clavipes]